MFPSYVSTKLGCVVSMVVGSILPHAEMTIEKMHPRLPSYSKLLSNIIVFYNVSLFDINSEFDDKKIFA